VDGKGTTKSVEVFDGPHQFDLFHGGLKGNGKLDSLLSLFVVAFSSAV
jgi:hypothetical protein